MGGVAIFHSRPEKHHGDAGGGDDDESGGVDSGATGGAGGTEGGADEIASEIAHEGYTLGLVAVVGASLISGLAGVYVATSLPRSRLH